MTKVRLESHSCTSCPDCGPLLEFVEAGSGAQQKAPARGVEAMARPEPKALGTARPS